MIAVELLVSPCMGPRAWKLAHEHMADVEYSDSEDASDEVVACQCSQGDAVCGGEL